MFISAVCENIHICAKASGKIKKTSLLNDIPVVFKSDTVFLRDFQAPTGRRALATHKRSYRPASLVSLKKARKTGAVWFCFDERVKLVVAEVWGRC